VLLNDGLSKGQADQEGKVADLGEGTPVSLRVSPYDKKSVLDIRVHGASVNGTVKGVDTGSNTITVTSKGEGGLVEKTFTLVKDARIDGKLADLTAGTAVNVQLSVFDKNKAVAVRVLQQGNEE